MTFASTHVFTQSLISLLTNAFFGIADSLSSSSGAGRQNGMDGDGRNGAQLLSRQQRKGCRYGWSVPVCEERKGRAPRFWRLLHGGHITIIVVVHFSFHLDETTLGLSLLERDKPSNERRRVRSGFSRCLAVRGARGGFHIKPPSSVIHDCFENFGSHTMFEMILFLLMMLVLERVHLPALIFSK